MESTSSSCEIRGSHSGVTEDSSILGCLRRVDRYIIYDVSKVCGVFIFRVKWSKKTGLLHPENEDIAILPNVVIYP